MITRVKRRRRKLSAEQQAMFLNMLPHVRTTAEIAFRSVKAEAREEMVAEVIANAFTAYCRLVEADKESVAYPTPLAWYAVKQVRAGRRVGSKRNRHDISSVWRSVPTGWLSSGSITSLTPTENGRKSSSKTGRRGQPRRPSRGSIFRHGSYRCHVETGGSPNSSPAASPPATWLAPSGSQQAA